MTFPMGTALADLAHRYGVTIAAVRAWLDDDGEPLGNTGRTVAWLRAAYVDQRRSMPDIAAELGVTKQRVGQWVMEHRIG